MLTAQSIVLKLSLTPSLVPINYWRLNNLWNMCSCAYERQQLNVSLLERHYFNRGQFKLKEFTVFLMTVARYKLPGNTGSLILLLGIDEFPHLTALKGFFLHSPLGQGSKSLLSVVWLACPLLASCCQEVTASSFVSHRLAYHHIDFLCRCMPIHIHIIKELGIRALTCWFPGALLSQLLLQT